MNKTFRYGLLAFLLSVVFSSVSASEAKAQNILGQILQRMDAQNKAITSLKADLTMVKYDAGLQVADKPKTGSTKYLSKSKLTSNRLFARVDWIKPVEEQLSVIGDDYEFYEPRIPRVVKGNTKNAKGGSKAGSILSFMTMSREELKANYVVVYIGEEEISGGVKTWHLQLTPKTAASYKQAELWVDGDGMPRQSKIVERNDDTTNLLLTNIEKNVKIDTSIFKLKYPSSIKPIPA